MVVKVTCHWTPWPICMSFESILPLNCLPAWKGEFGVNGRETETMLHCMCWEGDIWDHLLCSKMFLFQFNEDGFLYPSLKPSAFSVQHVYITVLKRVSLFLERQVHCWVLTWRADSPMLCHAHAHMYIEDNGSLNTKVYRKPTHQ